MEKTDSTAEKPKSVERFADGNLLGSLRSDSLFFMILGVLKGHQSVMPADSRRVRLSHADVFAIIKPVEAQLFHFPKGYLSSFDKGIASAHDTEHSASSCDELPIGAQLSP